MCGKLWAEYIKTEVFADMAKYQELEKLLNGDNSFVSIANPKPVKRERHGHCKECEILLKYGGSGTEEYCEGCANEMGILNELGQLFQDLTSRDDANY